MGTRETSLKAARPQLRGDIGAKWLRRKSPLVIQRDVTGLFAHAFGYRRHCLTKSRRYSTTFKALRQAREAFVHAQLLARSTDATLGTGKPRIRARSSNSCGGIRSWLVPQAYSMMDRNSGPSAQADTELRWTGYLPGSILVTGEHSFTLKPGNGGTLIMQRGAFRGFMVRFSGRALDRAEAGFQALNGALKARVETS